MTWALEPVRIAASNVSIRNYDRRDIPRIAKAIDDPRGWFGIHWKYDSPEKIVRVLESQLAAWEAGTANPLAYFVGDEAAGITRFLRIEPREKTLEIGGTWVAPKWRKTFVNTKVKFLLLRHCFETLAAERIEFRVDARNTQSQEAVLRLGATLEGRLRHRQLYPDGKVRDGFLFSIVRPEWERVKAGLLALLRDPARDESRTARPLPPDRAADTPLESAQPGPGRGPWVRTRGPASQRIPRRLGGTLRYRLLFPNQPGSL